MSRIQKIVFHIVLIAGIAMITKHYGHFGEAFAPADAQFGRKMTEKFST